jgi:HD-GYP domain-containing protein (c-di-GMP phosphodiesterase class II)
MNEKIISVIKNYFNYADIMQEYNNFLTKPIYKNIKSTNFLIIMAIERVMAKHSNETCTHAINMSQILLPLAVELRLSKKEIGALKLIAKLHDIGKIAIAPEILNKQGPLSSEEWRVIKTHVTESYKIIKCFKEFDFVANDVLHHHERYDGTGYPSGLTGEAIPYFSRIISVIDAYEVIVNGRVYKKGVSPEEALAEIKRCSGTQFDPKIVEAFETVFYKNKIKNTVIDETFNGG